MVHLSLIGVGVVVVFLTADGDATSLPSDASLFLTADADATSLP